ncbi:MAG: OmpA family protein [Verrucomicrobia bacterium]|jgi:peptidoglycan-associated lipoprotein|nr:OmpA family protein [Verrucomicrobiota bacterium]
MKALKFANLLMIALALTVPAVGCKKKPTNVTPLPGQPGYVGDGGAAGLEGGGALGPGSETGAGGGPLADPSRFANMKPDREALAAYTVYFDFDSSVVRSSEQGKVAEVAASLNSSTANALRIEGHCDERGTEGYNLSLGERRALALREALVAAGVSADRMETISYGEERPADAGHDEIAWSKNRRGEFILLLP